MERRIPCRRLQNSILAGIVGDVGRIIENRDSGQLRENLVPSFLRPTRQYVVILIRMQKLNEIILCLKPLPGPSVFWYRLLVPSFPARSIEYNYTPKLLWAEVFRNLGRPTRLRLKVRVTYLTHTYFLDILGCYLIHRC